MGSGSARGKATPLAQISVGLEKFSARVITYLLRIRKCACHVYAQFNVFVLLCDDLDPVHFAMRQSASHTSY